MGYINPYLYIIFILMLPASLNRNVVLLLGFAIGLAIDVFENTGGLHASATAFLAFLRPYLFSLAIGSPSAEINRINLQTIGSSRFLALSAIAVFLHHIWLFSLEAFRISEWLYILERTFLSGIFTMLLIYLAQVLVYRKTE
jgi:hypothetical protein